MGGKTFPVDRKGEFEYAHVDGTRDGFHYEVHYWPVNKRENTYVYTLVYRNLIIGDDRP